MHHYTCTCLGKPLGGSVVCGLLTCRGMLPFAERKQVIMQAQDRLRAVRYGSSAGREGVGEGSTVCLRSSPVYPVGCRAIHISGGQLQVRDGYCTLFAYYIHCVIIYMYTTPLTITLWVN